MPHEAADQGPGAVDRWRWWALGGVLIYLCSLLLLLCRRNLVPGLFLDALVVVATS
jgi:hypothetical protein